MQINEQDFLSFLTTKQGLADNSIRLCRTRIGVINKWLGDKELTKENVEKFFLWKKEQGLKNSSLSSYRFVFLQLKEYRIDRGLSSGFLDGFKPFKKIKPNIIIFTQEEIERILNTSLTYGKFEGKDCSFLDFRYRTLSTFLAHTGCRISEALNLRINKVDISAGKVTFINTKTNENRTNYFTEPLKTNLTKLVEGRNPEDYVFINARNHQMNDQDYSEDLKRRAVAARVTKRTFPHNFRHSYITHMLEAGVPITEVATLVGHKDIQTTYSTYMHLADKTLQRAAMRHPMVRKNVDTREIIRELKEAIEGFHLNNDKRFMFSLSEEDNQLNFKIITKQKGQYG